MCGRLLILLGILLLMPMHARAGQIKLKVTLPGSASGWLGTSIALFKTELERRSDGALSVEILDNSQLVELFTDNEAVGAVASGVVEMGAINYQQLTVNVPALGVLEQPFLFNAALAQAATAPDSEIRQLLDQAILEATGLRVLWWQSYGSSVLFSKGRDARRPSGIRGQRVWVPGDNMASFTRHCGGDPLLHPSTEVQPIGDGNFDMAMTSIVDIQTGGLSKVVDTITRTEHAALEMLIIINEPAWRSLGVDAQRAVIEAGRAAERDLRARAAVIEAKAYAFARSKGMRIHDLTPDDVFEWRACSAQLLDDFVKDAGEMAVSLMAAYGRLRMQPCCNSGPAGVFSLR